MPESYTTFGDFLLLRQRSQDGLGTLWRAGELERTGFKRIAWLRRFDGAGLDRAALEAEAPLVRQIAQALKATNIARNTVMGSAADAQAGPLPGQPAAGTPYLAFDYVPGQSLDRLMARVASDQFPVAIDNALLIVEKIAAALTAAQAFEVRGETLIHGFLVPHFVTVGNDGEAVVAGFGLMKGLLSNLDRIAVRELAAPYLAPEVLATYIASRRGDVYSVGAILYQLLTGKALPGDVGARPAALTAPELAAEEGPVPADVLTVLRKCLADRPDERYASVTDLKRDLEKLLYGGAYSPTTFNLALFMDRLCRQEIEEEDRELQRERTLDVSSYYRPQATAEPAPAAPAPAPASRTGLYAAIGAVVVLLAVVGYLLFGRGGQPAQPQQNVADLIQSEVARQLAEKEQQLRDQLDREKQETDKLRQQLAAQQKAAASPGSKVSPEEQKRQADLAQQLAAREAEQRQREAELKKIQDERARAAAAVKPTAVPAVPTVAPLRAAEATPVPQPTAAPAAAPASEVAAAPTAVPTAPPVAPGLPLGGLGTAVREGDLVDFTQVDTPPQELVSVKPVFGRAAMIAKARGIAILSVLVNSKGGVDDVKVLRPFAAANLGIDEACVEAARKYRYRPATKGGVNVKTWTTLTFQIDLARGR